MAKPERRADALSRERIVEAAIALLDEAGEAGLTFRALGARLATGAGAIYWHVADKGDLLAAATDAVIARALDAVGPATKPRAAIHAIALGVFDAVDAHPWVGAELTRGPWSTAMLWIFERLGREVRALGARPTVQFTAACALQSYVVGQSIQNAANAARGRGLDRATFLAEQAARWEALDEAAFPFTRTVGAQLRRHDDRAEFLAGVDLILGGLAAPR